MKDDLTLQDLGFPAEAAQRLREIGVASVSDVALHLDSNEQQQAFAEAFGLTVDSVAEAVDLARQTIPTEMLQSARDVAEIPRVYGVLPPAEENPTGAAETPSGSGNEPPATDGDA